MPAAIPEQSTVPHSALSYFAAEARETARLAARACRTPIAFAWVEIDRGKPLLGLMGLEPDNPSLIDLSAIARRLIRGEPKPSALPLGLRHIVVAPVSNGGGPTRGFLLVADHESRADDPEDDATVRTLARRLAESLDLRRQARELRAAEAALNRVQENFSTLVEGLDSGLVLEDETGRIVLVNRGFTRRFAPGLRSSPRGRLTAEVFAEMAIAFRQPEDFLALARAERRSTERQLGRAFETTDGRTLEVDALPVRGPEGARHIYQFRDVSEHVRAMRSLDTWFQVSLALIMSNDKIEAAERVLRTLLDGLGFRAGCLWERDATSRWSLTAACAVLESEQEALVRASQAASFDAAADLVGQCASTGQTTWVHDAQNEPSFLRVELAATFGLRSVILTPAHGDNRILGVLELLDTQARENDDARARVMAGAADQLGQFLARQNALSRLRSSEARFRAVVETIEEGLLLCSPDGAIVDLNPAATALLGRPRSEFSGARAESFLAAVPFNATILERGLTLPETEARRADGTTFPASVLVHPIDTEDGRLLVVHLRDLSARREIDRLRKQFVSTVSHELRTPLTSIRASLGLLSIGVAGELPEEARKVVGIAERNTERLVGLINDIIDLERAEGGHLKLRIARVTAGEVIDRAVEAVSSLAAQEAMILEVVTAEGVVAGDSERLTQVLVNLVSNAVKFAPRGSRIAVAASLQGDVVRFSVTDEGPGIPEPARRMIFEPFRQIEDADTRKKGGSGLGLSICKAIVEQHGGVIGVDDAPGGGSLFFFTVPAVVIPT